MKKSVLFFVSFLLVSMFAAATTRYVPGSYPTIQAAINASAPGDIIQVASGNYIESLTVGIDNLTIMGAGMTLTFIKTKDVTPAIILSANGFTLKNLQITNNRQAKECIRVIAPASTGLMIDGVYFNKLGNDSKNAYGINVGTSMTNVTVKNSQFAGTMASARAIGIYGGRGVTQTNWLVQNTYFSYIYAGIYLNSTVSGLLVTNNNFGPWDLADCKQAASGLYIGDGAADFDINGVTVTSNTFNSYARGVYFLNNAANRTIGTTVISNNTFTNSIWSSGIRLVAGTQEYGTYAPSVLLGPVTVSDNHFTQSTKIVNGSGVSMIDFRAVTGGESPVSMISVLNNDITFNGTFDLATWGILLRGPISHAAIQGNVLAGNGAGGVSPYMPPTSGICLQTNYLDYGQMSAVANINIGNNTITGFVNGISVYDMMNKIYGAIPAGAMVRAGNNTITGNTWGIYSGTGERTFARNNWWGSNTGPNHATNPGGTGNPVTDFVDFLPWWCDAGMTSICPQGAPGQAILNTGTGTWYPSTGLADAFSAALSGQTLFVAAGNVNSAGFDFPGKSVELIGTGIPGESVIGGPGSALALANGSLSIGNGLSLNTTGAHTIAVAGGALKVRDCILSADADKSTIDITGGTVDAGTWTDRGNNLFEVSSGDVAISNTPLVTVNAIGNDWGSSMGPTIASNPGGDGGAIIGTGKDYVLYDPWRGGPVTVASKVKVCFGETTATIPVKVARFVNVGSLALQMNYDVTKLSNPVLSYQDPAFGQWGSLMVNTLTPGTVIVNGAGAWPDNGISLADSTVIFNLTFNLVSGATYATLDFYEDLSGSSCEYTGSSPFFLKYGDVPQATHYLNGSVSLDPNPPVPVSVTIAVSENPVEPGNPVTFTATPVNGGATPAYQWKVKGMNAGTNSPVFTYYPVTGDDVKCILTSSAPCVTGNPATSNTIEVYVVYANIFVSDTVYNSETNCYDASQVITVAYLPNTFLVQTGGSATLIAGQKIMFGTGTTIQAGGYVHAYIAPDGPFCPPAFVSATPTATPEVAFSSNDAILFKVYPNPTTGSFTLAQRGDEPFEQVTMTVYSMRGERIMVKELSGELSYSCSISGYPSGFYFIRVIAGDHVETIKLIKTN